MSRTAASKWRSAADAVDAIASGMTVGLGHVGAEPTALTAALWERGRDLRDVTLLSGMMLTGYPFLKPETGDGFRLKTWFMPGTLLSAEAREVEAEYLPLNWTQTARFLLSAGTDVALVQVSEADAAGYHSLGISTGQHRPMIRGSKLVIAEVNPAMPRTCGDSLIHESELDILVRAEHPLIAFPHRDGDPIDRAIGLKAAELIGDGTTIQFGIGTIPGAMLDGLLALGRCNLRILSQISDPARALIEAGACVADGPKAIVGEVIGSHALYEWARDNADLAMADALSTHAIAGFATRERFVSVNSALEIDLYGQVNSETLDGRQVGAIGGSIDFAIGAQLDGNLSIIALRSATKRGEARIVPVLKPGPVTVPRSLVQVVVTEHGVADLRNRTMKERAQALAAIAHPDHREDLARHAAAIR
ncbi:acetyl-CoA hydrolase/transferase family protein [Chelatococcus reniformis]|uniref:4-hydroxybutyrate CoA-transferase n=1 Tax=Chelatococcus reniformis TaxID=1494448 RepID=A0A916UM95_9HYPH|nr:acetyl-CoA hydrolase/transferase family protein [Chelatococcus reniformis]GGC78018.1 4-hydroxybutyrate CoA-transferase [Chelatococcus reniformis]